ncbi:hypothetical protein KJ865_09205, partial [Myxococcota bacterium]|nr:hypothetical protein [Myxococcota bacterium]
PTETDKMKLTVRTRHRGKADLKLSDPEGTHIANIYISLEAANLRRPHGSKRDGRHMRGVNLPKLPSIGLPDPPMDPVIMSIMLPEPPEEMKPPKSMMKADSRPMLPELPDF